MANPYKRLTSDPIEAANWAAWDQEEKWRAQSPQDYSAYHDPTLRGRMKALGSIGLLLGLLFGALSGAKVGSFVWPTLLGIVVGAALGAVVGAMWHLVVVVVGGVARALWPMLRGAFKGALAGVGVGVLLGFFNAQGKHPAETVFLLGLAGAAIGGVVGIVQLARRLAARAQAPAVAPPSDKKPGG